MDPLFYLVPIGSLITLGFAAFQLIRVVKADEGNPTIKEISEAIRKGAEAYLRQQYKVVAIFFIAMFILLGIISYFGLLSKFVPFAFLFGGVFSGFAGFVGMYTSTHANSRTVVAAQKSLNSGLRLAFASGTVMGMTVVGLALLYLSVSYIFLHFVLNITDPIREVQEITTTMLTFGMGASSMALFARLGGGIFTKAADVGADLVGKIEAGIPEDDPRNPATIADNVGDNVGDVAGLGADLYESYVGSIVATMAIGAMAFGENAAKAIMIPLLVSVLGALASIIGTFVVRTGEKATQEQLLNALRGGVYLATGIIFALSAWVIEVTVGFSQYFGIWIAIVVGLMLGNVIGYFTEFYTSDSYRPTKDLSGQATTGPATIIIGGVALGMKSTAIPVLCVVLGMIIAYFFAMGGSGNPGMGLYGVGIAAVGMLATLGITLATDAYGPVADNAGGIAEMAGLDPEVRERTDALDSLGNTTAATGKGFAIGSAALTALALLASYTDALEYSLDPVIYEKLHMSNIHIMDPIVLSGLFIGAMLPFFFSAMTMSAVGRAAQSMVKEVRRQFKDFPGILKGTEKPDYQSCVAISTKGAQKEMIAPTILAIFAPIVVGVLFGPKCVVAMQAGALVSGFALAIMMANSGGAWDNAKKHIEAGNHGGKGGDPHKAAVVGDTVGDPFKDTCGPSIDILLKLMSMVSIVFATTVVSLHLPIVEMFKNFLALFY